MEMNLIYPNLSCLISYKILDKVWSGSYLRRRMLINIANRQKFFGKSKELHSYFTTKFK